MPEQLQFFIHLLPHIYKPFAVRFAHIGKYAYGGLNDLLQLLHFAGLRNTGFKNGQLMLLVQRPNTQRHAYLRVVTFGTANNGESVIEQLVQPFFYNGFSIAAGNTYNRQVELFAVPRYQVLQRLQGIINLYAYWPRPVALRSTLSLTTKLRTPFSYNWAIKECPSRRGPFRAKNKDVCGNMSLRLSISSCSISALSC